VANPAGGGWDGLLNWVAAVRPIRRFSVRRLLFLLQDSLDA